MKVICPHCGHQGKLPDGGALPAMVRCPHCQNTFQPAPYKEPAGEAEAISVAEALREEPPSPSTTIFCPKCGQKNLENNFKCLSCGFTLHGTQPPVVAANDGTLGGLIPYKNSQALISYYLGVFSLIPCLGIPLGVVALILGIRGLQYAKLNPQARGKAHAWTGIILGGITAIGYTLLIAVPILMAMLSK